MHARSHSYPKRALVGLLLALAIAVSVVGASDAIRAIASGRPLFAEWPEPATFRIMIAGAPFLLLALLGIGARQCWLIALALTVGFWAFYTYVVIQPDDGGGANIGLGILMMASPVPIAAASLLALRYRKRPTLDR